MEQRDIVETRRRLFEARERRVKPARDEKILAAWNGMMIGALAEGYRALGDERYLKAAAGGAEFVMDAAVGGTRSSAHTRTASPASMATWRITRCLQAA